MIRSLPKKNSYLYNVCAFCHYWEGNAHLHSRGSASIEFDERAKGRCLTKGLNGKTAATRACSQFQMSNEASRYCR